jgi:hypothetical protein
MICRTKKYRAVFHYFNVRRYPLLCAKEDTNMPPSPINSQVNYNKIIILYNIFNYLYNVDVGC